MPIDKLGFLQGLGSLTPSTAVKDADRTRNAAFEDILGAYMGMLEETNRYEKAADTAQLDYALGKTDDIAGVLLAQEKAYASLNFTVQVTNKVLDAYREIMRISM